MRIVIVGPGALGSLLTARIALLSEKRRAAGSDNDQIDICLLDYRLERARQIRESGLLVDEKGQHVRCSVRVETEPGVCSGCDVLFLCVKSTAVTSTLERIAPFLSPDTLFVAMQNGIGHLESISTLPCLQAAGVTSEGATLLAPGHVRHGGAGITRLGILDVDHNGGQERLAEVVSLFNAAGLETYLIRNPLRHIWAKLFINVAINALTAIHRCPNGQLLRDQETKEIMRKAVHEAVAVAGSLGIPVEGDPVEAAYGVCAATAANISSMLQDVRNQQQTEIDAINGAVVAHGMRLGIPTPVNADLVRQIRQIEASYIR